MKSSPNSLAQNLMKPKYQPRADGGNRSLPEMLQNQKWDPGVPKWPTGSGKGLTLVIVHWNNYFIVGFMIGAAVV